MEARQPFPEDSTLLLTGASGFLGTALLRHLDQEPYAVRAFYYRDDDVSHLGSLSAEMVPGDICRPADVEQVVEGADAIIHAAGNVSFHPSDRQRQERVNVMGTENVLRAAERHAVRRLVHVSTVNAFGYPPQGAVGDEGTVYNWSRFNIGYMETKKRAQDLVLSEAGKGFDAVVVNPTTMFGPEDVNLNAASYILEIHKAPSIVPCPPGGTNIADVRAVAAGILQALHRGRAGECYILGGMNVTYRDLFAVIAQKLGLSRMIVPLPFRVLRAAATLVEMTSSRTGSRPPLTRDMVYASAKCLFYSSRKANDDLGYEPGDPLQAIDDSIIWLQEAGFLESSQ